MRIALPEELRRFADDQAFAEAEGSSVADILRNLAHQRPQLGERLLDSGGTLFAHLVILCDDAPLPHRTLETYRPTARQTLEVFIAASGG